MGLLSPRAPFSVLCQHESALKRSESPCRWRRVRKLGARWSLLQAHGRVERPGSANFDHVELARECGWERRVRAMAFDDAPDRFIDFHHTAGDHKSDRLDRAITSNGHRHYGRRVRPLRQFADGFDRGVELDLAGLRFGVLNKFQVGVAAAPQPDAARRAQRVGSGLGGRATAMAASRCAASSSSWRPMARSTASRFAVSSFSACTRAASCRAVSRRCCSSRAAACRADSCRAASWRAVSARAASWRAVSCRCASNRVAACLAAFWSSASNRARVERPGDCAD